MAIQATQIDDHPFDPKLNHHGEGWLCKHCGLAEACHTMGRADGGNDEPPTDPPPVDEGGREPGEDDELPRAVMGEIDMLDLWWLREDD